MRVYLLIIWMIAFGVTNLNAQVKLPSIVSDSMILQRDTKVKIWGWAAPNENVRIAFNKKTFKTKADKAGNWFLYLPPVAAGGPYSLTVSGNKNSITLNEILFGDVWFCSGQSNMVHQLNLHDVTYEKEIREANYPHIRQFWIPTITNLQQQQTDIPHAQWKAAVGDNVRPFSGVAYFFAKKIADKYNIPVGIINASVGGTPIQAWISEDGLKSFPEMMETIQKNKDTAYVNETNRKATLANTPTPSKDLGLLSPTKWFDINYKPIGWHNINIPGYWEDQGIKDLNGVVWFRKEIDIPAAMSVKASKVFLGRIVDADELYINGNKIGNTGYMYPQRRYPVAPSILKEGKNIFVIRVTNHNGKGGFVPDKPYYIFSGNDTIDLKGTWQYKVGEAFPTNKITVPGISLQNQPSALYNAMVAPVNHYTIKGFCWYQGESNAGYPSNYTALQTAQIHNWRNKWNMGNLPFLYVQLPGFMDYNYHPTESSWALFREAQLNALSVPNTGMAVAIDLGEWNDVHPDNKKDVGERLALVAFKKVYNENIIHSGPLYQSSSIQDNKIVLQFTNTGSGLIIKDNQPPAEFAIAGADKKFVWANTKIEGNTIIVWSNEIKEPKYVRYAWADNPVNPNLYNKEGLPASPFRTDD